MLLASFIPIPSLKDPVSKYRHPVRGGRSPVCDGDERLPRAVLCVTWDFLQTPPPPPCCTVPLPRGAICGLSQGQQVCPLSRGCYLTRLHLEASRGQPQRALGQTWSVYLGHKPGVRGEDL